MRLIPQQIRDFVRPNNVRSHRGFTLTEVSVVGGIVAVLAVLMLPALSRVREKTRASSCLNNLRQVGTAVQLYQQDFHRYPASLTDLVPPMITLTTSTGDSSAHQIEPPGAIQGPPDGGSNAPSAAGSTQTIEVKSGGAGYLRSLETLRCPNDNLRSPWLRSSYGTIKNPPPSGDTTAPELISEPLVWDYYGYYQDGNSLPTAQAAATFAATSTGKQGLVHSERAYNARTNPFKMSLTGFVPAPDAIITHCRFHRTQTSALSRPEELYADPAQSTGARDTVLRLDGSARLVDVSGFKTSLGWLKSG